jgi:putative tryptophan/tyrosine transport system substrate-binding protein
MRRREFIILLGGAAAAWPLEVRSQRSTVPRVGYVFPFAQAASQELWQACRQGLRELGYNEEQNVILEPRWAEEQYERLPTLVSDLLRLNVDASLQRPRRQAWLPRQLRIRHLSSLSPLQTR